MARRRHVKPHDIAHLGDKIRVRRKLEGLLPMRLQAERPQMRWTVDVDRPQEAAIPRELRCVASSGWLSSVRTITVSIRASSILRGAPERGSSRKPSTRSVRKRRRHLPTVIGQRLSRLAVRRKRAQLRMLVGR